MNRVIKEFTKGFGVAFKDMLGSYDDYTPWSIPIDPSTHHTPDGQDGWALQATGSTYSYFKYESYSSAVGAYEKCPPISAIINRKAQAFTNGKLFILNSKGKEATGVQATSLRKLMDKPNPLQSRKQFEAQGYIYQQMFGFNIILPIIPIGFEDKVYATSLWNIPANWIDVKATEENFTRKGGVALTSIIVNFNGSKIEMQLKDLIIIRDNFPSFKTLTFPASRLLSLEKPISNIIGALDSRGTIITNRGAMGILSTDPGKGQYVSQPLDDTQKKELQQDFRRYGLRSNQWQVILTTASLKWQSMVQSTKELMLIEEVQESTKMICDNLNFPPHLLGLIDPTFNNQSEAKKSLYQDSIIPDAESYYEQLTQWFGLDKWSIRLDKDFSHLPVLQEDKSKSATARKVLNEALKIEFEQGLITLNEWLVEIGKDPIPDGDVRYAEARSKSMPLAVLIGVGGVQSIISVITATGVSPEAKQASLEIIFGLSPADAERMSQNDNYEPDASIFDSEEENNGGNAENDEEE